VSCLLTTVNIPQKDGLDFLDRAFANARGLPRPLNLDKHTNHALFCLPLVSFLALPRFKNPSTRTHVRLLGPCSKTGRMGSPQAVVAQRPEGRALRRARTGRADDGFQRHLRPLGLGRRRGRQQSTPRADRRTSKTVPHTTGAHRWDLN